MPGGQLIFHRRFLASVVHAELLATHYEVTPCLWREPRCRRTLLRRME
jgi:hypothetical protein